MIFSPKYFNVSTIVTVLCSSQLQESSIDYDDYSAILLFCYFRIAGLDRYLIWVQIEMDSSLSNVPSPPTHIIKDNEASIMFRQSF